MAILLEFSVPADSFPLGRVFEALPSAVIELERIVPSQQTLCPYVWVSGVSAADVERAFDETTERAIRSFTLVDDVEDRGLLYRVGWSDDVAGLVTAIVASPVTLLSGSYRNTAWTFQVRVDDHDDVVRFRKICLNHDVPVSLSRLQPLSSATEDDDWLTPPQLEALGLAFERGYFDEPRRVTLEELARELGITRQSLAGRLRRGHRNLLAHVLANESLDDGDPSA